MNEYLSSGDILELADIEEVLLAILNVKNVEREEFEEKRIEKVLRRGAFKEKYF